MAETMILPLEGRDECRSIGRNVSLGRVDEIAHLASEHGVGFSGFRSFERVVTDEEIEKIRDRARQTCLGRAWSLRETAHRQRG
jgi:fatty aldehyde-generating acyl-ACP reductase